VGLVSSSIPGFILGPCDPSPPPPFEPQTLITCPWSWSRGTAPRPSFCCSLASRTRPPSRGCPPRSCRSRRLRRRLTCHPNVRHAEAELGGGMRQESRRQKRSTCPRMAAVRGFWYSSGLRPADSMARCMAMYAYCAFTPMNRRLLRSIAALMSSSDRSGRPHTRLCAPHVEE
jgi:hypothetical protein